MQLAVAPAASSRTCCFAGVMLSDTDMGGAVNLVQEAVASRGGLAIHLCNAYTLTLAAEQPEYAVALGHRSINFPDGVPVTWFFRWQSGTQTRGPVRGPTLMRRILELPDVRHFLLGGTPDSLTRLRQQIALQPSPANVVGQIAPSFGPITDHELDDWATAIRACGAQIVWVGLGTPKQDEVIARLVDRVDAVLVGVGAAFDFLSGAKREAPPLLRGTGLEWVHRLSTEPRRLWRRYLFGNIRFLRYAFRELHTEQRGACMAHQTANAALAPDPDRRSS